TRLVSDWSSDVCSSDLPWLPNHGTEPPGPCFLRTRTPSPENPESVTQAPGLKCYLGSRPYRLIPPGLCLIRWGPCLIRRGPCLKIGRAACRGGGEVVGC